MTRFVYLAVLVLAACAAPAPAPRVAACDADIVRLKPAAQAGNGVAQYRLAIRYYLSWLNPGLCASGAGVEDAVEAYRWFTLAANQGIEAASRRRDTLAESMSPDHVAEAERRASLGPEG